VLNSIQTARREPILAERGLTMTIINWREKAGASFYNGGWVKTVTGIDKTKSNGYCFEGDFISGADKGLTEVDDGFYIVCDIQGSRRHPERNFGLFQVQGDNVEQVLDWVQGGDWALQIRDKVADILAADQEDGPVEFTGDEMRLLEQLKALAPDRLEMVLKALRK
jgi:hypothetical protein